MHRTSDDLMSNNRMCWTSENNNNKRLFPKPDLDMCHYFPKERTKFQDGLWYYANIILVFSILPIMYCHCPSVLSTSLRWRSIEFLFISSQIWGNSHHFKDYPLLAVIYALQTAHHSLYYFVRELTFLAKKPTINIDKEVQGYHCTCPPSIVMIHSISLHSCNSIRWYEKFWYRRCPFLSLEFLLCLRIISESRVDHLIPYWCKNGNLQKMENYLTDKSTIRHSLQLSIKSISFFCKSQAKKKKRRQSGRSDLSPLNSNMKSLVVVFVLICLWHGIGSKYCKEFCSPIPTPQGWNQIQRANRNSIVSLTIAVKQRNMDLLEVDEWHFLMMNWFIEFIFFFFLSPRKNSGQWAIHKVENMDSFLLWKKWPNLFLHLKKQFERSLIGFLNTTFGKLPTFSSFVWFYILFFLQFVGSLTVFVIETWIFHLWEISLKLECQFNLQKRCCQQSFMRIRSFFNSSYTCHISLVLITFLNILINT